MPQFKITTPGPGFTTDDLERAKEIVVKGCRIAAARRGYTTEWVQNGDKLSYRVLDTKGRVYTGATIAAVA